MKFYIKKTQIVIEFSFFLIIALSLLFNNFNILYVLLFSTLHECGHVITLYVCGGYAQKITISYYGIGLKHNSSFSFPKQIAFYLSGIAVNFIFYLLNFQKEINLCLLIVNILPVYPLDGGRALKAILNKIFNLYLSDKIFKYIGIAALSALIIYSLYSKNISMILICAYVIVYSLNNSTN